MEKIKCAVPGCENDALILYAGKLICGEHFMKIYNKQQQKQWEELVNDSNQDSR